ncbi:MAG: TetR/AcrR family transcriptional regulator [Spirochaetales bacterium]|nr:TetR/AcrR family transcriptional regulator [Spirochaetales bacterium]
MPKIIENLRQRLMDEAFEEIKRDGYAAMTIRSVAKAVGVGTGTIYNYFSSKEALVASFMLEEWNGAMKRVKERAGMSEKLSDVLAAVYGEIRGFLGKFSAVVSDEEATKTFRNAIGSYHKILRGQIAGVIRRFVSDDFEAEFIAEAMITWSVEGVEFEILRDVITRRGGK